MSYKDLHTTRHYAKLDKYVAWQIGGLPEGVRTHSKEHYVKLWKEADTVIKECDRLIKEAEMSFKPVVVQARFRCPAIWMDHEMEGEERGLEEFEDERQTLHSIRNFNFYG